MLYRYIHGILNNVLLLTFSLLKYGIYFAPFWYCDDVAILKAGFHMIVDDRRSQKVLRSFAIIWKHTSAIVYDPTIVIADNRRQSQKIEHGSVFCDLPRSFAMTIGDDCRSVFPYDRRRSQNFLLSAISDPRSSAIIWKPALSSAIFCDRLRSSAIIWKPKFCDLRSKRIPYFLNSDP